MCSILAYCGPTAGEDTIEQLMQTTISRGPDDTRVQRVGNGWLGFNRLAIMGLSASGMQPFVTPGGSACVCNGEIYGFRPLKRALEEKGYTFASGSDCEILLPLYAEMGVAMFRALDAEFALVIYDAQRHSWIAARDPIGIRPLYYGYDAAGTIVFASEPKTLVGHCAHILPFPPGHYYRDGQFICYRDFAVGSGVVDSGQWDSELVGSELVDSELVDSGQWGSGQSDRYCHDELPVILANIHDKLLAGIQKRLDADAPVGFLLSGGLDSSLVCGAAARLSDKPLETFSIGMDIDAIDLKYAREVAAYIGSNHHEVIITRDDVIAALRPVIALLGTFDITTIRASIGMYLVCKWIHEHTDRRVILTGEISDELFGYKYTDFAPSPAAFQSEAEKRVRELHMYDVLRADRCISVNSLEARVPFGDLDFVDYVMHIDPAKKVNTYGIGKYLLRKAFEPDALIPHSILMREKAAFSDAVGHSLVNDLKDYAEGCYTDEAFEQKRTKYTHAAPFTKESLLYREIFEAYYPGQAAMITDFWMPNKSWAGCDVNDPSARVLANYGASGQ